MDRQSLYQFRKICFVQTGGSGDAGAFARALRLSERTQAELNVVSVAEEPPTGMLSLTESLGVTPDAITGEGEDLAEVARLVEMAHRQKLASKGEVLRGKPFVEVVRKVLRDGYDLLIKAAQPSSAVRTVLFGHTDRQLIRKCPCPVWIDKPSTRTSYDRILAAVDPDPFREEGDLQSARDALNGSILELAIALAQAEQAELHVVHAWEFYLEGALRSRAGLAGDAIAKVRASVRHKHQQALRDLTRPFEQHIARVHLLGATGLPRLVLRC